MIERPVVLLLAGGKSTRFWPLSEKNTYQFAGKNLVERHIETLKKLGFRDLIVVASDKVFDWLVENSARFADFNINYVKQKDEIKGMAGAVLSAAENFRTHFKNRSLYILNCNDVYEESLHTKVLSSFENQSKEEIFVTGYLIKEYQPLGYWIVEGDRVKGIREKPGKNEIPSSFTNLVVHLFRNPESFLEKLEKLAKNHKEADDLYEQALDELLKIEKGALVKYEGKWEIFKYPWQVLSVMEYFLSQIESTLIDPSAEISERANISGKVIFSEGVKILEGSKIAGPCYIGKNTIIGNNVLVRQSMIGENCVIGFGSEVVRSYLGNQIWLHQNYIGDSILEGNISLGAGTVTGNFRLDEKNISSMVKDEKVDTKRNKLGVIVGKDVRIGVNASLMPGVKIGSDSLIGPGVILYEDLPEEKFCTVKQELNIKENKVKIPVREFRVK